MRITIVKKGTVNAKPSGQCDSLIDDFPMNKSK